MSHAIPTQVDTHASGALRTVDLAGSEWPLYKLEALTVGFLILAVALALSATAQVAVLGAAASAVALWWALRFTEVGFTGLGLTRLRPTEVPRS